METLYQTAKDIILKFKKKGYYEEFSQQDMFYFSFINEGKKMMMLFIDSFFGDSYGIQLFFNNNGFEYLHHIFTTPNPDSITIGDCDSIFGIIKAKKDLLPDDYAYLKENHVRVKEEDNVIFYRFQTGYDERYCNEKEVSDFILAGSFVLSLLKNDYNPVKECFNEAYSVVAEIDTDKLTYEVRYQDLPYLIPDKRKVSENKNFVLEFKNAKYIDDEIDFYTTYLPIKIKETRKRVMLNLIHYKKYGYNDVYFIKDKTTVKSALMGMLYDSFMKHGVPLEVNFSHNEYSDYSIKTLEKLHVDVKTERVSDDTMDVAQRIGDELFDISHDNALPQNEVDDALNVVKDKALKNQNNNNSSDTENNGFGFIS